MCHTAGLSVDALRELVERGNGADRAYVDAMIRMRWSRTKDRVVRTDLQALHEALRAAALTAHAKVRTEIAKGALRGPALRAHFDSVAASDRDHFVEEVLGVAYPPLEEPTLERELVTYSPSGYDEIVHAFDLVQLASGDRFFDFGSGMGKVVLLAALLTGATAAGVEQDETLHDLAQRAMRDLGVIPSRMRFADARAVEIDDADVFFMYLPFTGGALATVLERLVEHGRRARPRDRQRYLCAGALDTERWSDFAIAGPPRSWLHVYAWSMRARSEAR